MYTDHHATMTNNRHFSSEQRFRLNALLHLDDDDVPGVMTPGTTVYAPTATSVSNDYIAPVADPEVHTSSTPGYCYLAMFPSSRWFDVSKRIGPYPPRSRVEAFFTTGESYHSGVFRLTFGTPASASLTQKFQAHVERAPDGTSMLKVKDVLALMPWGSRFGDGTGLAEQQTGNKQVVTLPSQLPVPSAPALFGTMPNPLERRICFEYTHLAVQVAPAGSMISGVVANSITPHTNAAIADYIKWGQMAGYVNLALRFVPTHNARNYHVAMNSCWYGTHETAPTTAAQFRDHSTHSVHAMTPTGASDTPTGLTILCPFVDGVQTLIKPAPWCGGTASFAYRYTSAVVSGDYTQGLNLYSVYVECTVTLVPTVG